jgi:hypothetical protein
MYVDAVLVLARLVLEIVGESEHRRELVASQRVEIGVAATGVDRAAADAKIGEPLRVIGHADPRFPVRLTGRRVLVCVPLRRGFANLGNLVEPSEVGLCHFLEQVHDVLI